MNNVFSQIGNIARDLELRTTSTDTKILDLTLAVRTSKDETLFITITLFNKLAETVNEYCHKGDLIGISGIIKNHNYEDKEGKKHYEYQFVGNKISFLQKKKEESKEEEKEIPQNTKTEYDIENSGIQLSDDDLPF